jgi:hypothetical protein
MTTLHTIKRRAIEHALELKRGNATAAAELLDIGRATIWRHLRDWKAQDRMMIMSTARSVASARTRRCASSGRSRRTTSPSGAATAGSRPTGAWTRRADY